MQRISEKECPDGGIGRRAGLKHQWIHFHAGSIPALGTHQWIHFHAGSIPALGTKNPDNRLIIGIFYLHRDTKKYAILSFPLPKQDKYTIFEKE